VRLDAGAEGLLVERPEVIGDGAHSVCDGGRPENSSPGAIAQSSTRWKYVMVRRPFIFVEKTIDQGLQWVVSEANDEPPT
jgi:hypothetical protein